MSSTMDASHAPELTSWVDSANDPASDFPVQNLPFGRFRSHPGEPWRVGVAIGDQLLDLRRAGFFVGDMAQLMAMAPPLRRALRQVLSLGLRQGNPDAQILRAALLPMNEMELGLPCDIGDCTDFYSSIHHATAVGRQFRPEQPLLPNYQWLPIAYHGRSSCIGVGRPGLGHTFARPWGQCMAAGADAPVLQPSARLDFELELAALMGTPNAPGQAVSMAEAEDHVFGLCLFNDWSARDIQAWEYQPLGPFLSKNFASTVSPWMVTLDALAPFRTACVRPEGDPQPLPYLDALENRQHGAIAIALEVWLQTKTMRDRGSAGVRLTQANYQDAYWTLAQLVAQHTVNGCPLRSGDLLGTGTQSGPQAGQGGSLLELTQGGRQPLLLAHGETRTFLEDGDTVILRAHCQRAGFRRIGFGECRGTVLAAR